MKNKFVIFIVVFIILVIGITLTFNQFSKSPKENIDLNSPSQVTTEEKNEPGATINLTKNLVALGSSLTKASNLSSQKQGENNDYSFSVGTKVKSLYLSLKQKEPGLRPILLASPGAEMKDILERQLSSGLSYQPEYITIDPGADIVSQTSLTDYRKYLSAILTKIDPQTKIFLFTYPNFVAMRKANYPSCQENKVGVNLGNLTENNILAFNKIIKELAATRKNVILLDIYNLLGIEDVSDYDCLHVNISGQEKIADGFIQLYAEYK